MEKDQDDEVGDCDLVLKANFLRLMNGRSVGRLREDMGDIGTGAIQKARNGDRGLRLETLAKFAAYFEIEPYRLLLPNLGELAWPFTSVTPDEFQKLTPAQRQSVENFTVFELTQPKDVGVKQVLPSQNPPTRVPGQHVVLSRNETEEYRDERSSDEAESPRKRGGGEGS